MLQAHVGGIQASIATTMLRHVRSTGSCRVIAFTVLGMLFVFLVFGSVHFYWGSAKNTVFRYHTKSRDVATIRTMASFSGFCGASGNLFRSRNTKSLGSTNTRGGIC